MRAVASRRSWTLSLKEPTSAFFACAEVVEAERNWTTGECKHTKEQLGKRKCKISLPPKQAPIFAALCLLAYCTWAHIHTAKSCRDNEDQRNKASRMSDVGVRYELSTISYYKPSTISYKLSNISYELSNISYELSIICYELSTIRYKLSIISYYELSTISYELSIISYYEL